MSTDRELAGVAEAAELLGVSTQRIGQLDRDSAVGRYSIPRHVPQPAELNALSLLEISTRAEK